MTATMARSALALVALLVWGCAGSSGPFVSSVSEPHAVLYFGSPPRPQYAQARLLVIDGQNVPSGATRISFMVTPGAHEIVVAAAITPATGTTVRGSRRGSRDGPGRLQLEVEAGKRYSIAAERLGARTDEWKPVVWRVEDK